MSAEAARQILTHHMKAEKADLFERKLVDEAGRKKLMRYSIMNFKSNPVKFNYSVFVQFIEYMRDFHINELKSWKEISEFGYESLDELINYMIVCDVMYS